MRSSVVTKFALVVGCIGLIAGVYGSSAFSTPSTKNYTAGLCAPSGAGCAANPAVSAGLNTFTVTIKNDATSTQALGSANVTFPTPPFQANSLTAPSAPTASGGKTWSATAVGNTLQLRNPGPNTTNALAPGQSVSVQVTAVASAASCSTYTLPSIAKQANDFSGSAGNNFVNTAPALPTVKVMGAGPLDHFTVNSIGTPQTAGFPFQVTATAINACGQTMTSYGGGASVSLLSHNPVAVPTTSPGFPPAAGTPPSYGAFSWNQGMGTVNVTSFAATSFNAGTSSYDSDFFVRVADGANVGSSNDLAVQPASPYKLTFVGQPSLTAPGAQISPAVQVKVQDQYGNLIPGASVALSLNTHFGTGSLSPASPTQTTDATGVATFSNLSVSQSGVYSLTATSPPFPNQSASATSNAFLVSDSNTNCQNTCSGSFTKKNNSTVSVNAAGTSNANTLAISLFSSDAQPPAGVCSGFTPAVGLGGSYFQVTGPGANNANLTVTWTIDKSIVNAQPNSGAAQYDICLGAINLNSPDGTGVTPWTDKDGNPAIGVPDAFLGSLLGLPGPAMVFWGVIPDVPNGISSCSQLPAGSGPAMLSRNKIGSGDVVLTFCVPSPWDNHGYGG